MRLQVFPDVSIFLPSYDLAFTRGSEAILRNAGSDELIFEPATAASLPYEATWEASNERVHATLSFLGDEAETPWLVHVESL